MQSSSSFEVSCLSCYCHRICLALVMEFWGRHWTVCLCCSVFQVHLKELFTNANTFGLSLKISFVVYVGRFSCFSVIRRMIWESTVTRFSIPVIEIIYLPQFVVSFTDKVTYNNICGTCLILFLVTDSEGSNPLGGFSLQSYPIVTLSIGAINFSTQHWLVS